MLSFAAILVVSAAVQAEGPVFYSGGRAHPLIRSETEFAVEIDPAAGVAATKVELLEKAGGLLKPAPGTTRIERHAILEVAQATPEAREAAAKAAGVRSVRPIYRFQPDGSPMMSTGELVAKVRPRLSEAQRTELFAEHGLEVVRPLHGLAGVYVLRPISADDEVEAAAALHRDRRVLYAHPDFRVKAERHQVVQDPFFGEQWHLENTGQGGGTPGADINVQEAWNITMGAGVRVGMLDDSCDVDHEDLVNNYLGISQDVATTGVEESRTAAVPELIDDAHGTAVMGLILAEANSLGVRGVAPEAKFTASQGIGRFVTFAQLASAYTYAEEQAVDVHNNSWGSSSDAAAPSVVADAIQSAFENGRGGLGMVVLFSSGNEPIELKGTSAFPTLPWVIGVGGSTADDVLSVNSTYGAEIDVLAPTNILDPGLPSMTTTDVTDGVYPGANGYNVGGFFLFTGEVDLPDPNYTMFMNGTSAACPVTTGVAALILSANPNLTATQVRTILEHTADRIAVDPEDPHVAPADYHGITGRSLKYGYGRINAGAAVAAAADSVDTGLTWPEPVTNVWVIPTDTGSTLTWTANDDLRGASSVGDRSVSFLVVQGTSLPFVWTPTDGQTYPVGTELAPLVTVVQDSDATEYAFPTSDEPLYFAIFARNAADRYSWGADSTLEVEPVIPSGPATPRVSVTAIPVSGVSPLTVEFRGNAQTGSGVASEEWDFGDGATDTQSTTTHTYTVPEGESQTFTATFTVVDVDGLSGSKSVAISVTSPVEGNTNDNGAVEDTAVSMILTDSEGAALNTSRAHPAPLRVYFSVDVSRLTLDVSRVVWSFGDGSDPNEGLSATHVYETAGSFAAAVEVYVQTSSGVEVGDPYSDYEVIPVSADPNANANVNDNTGGGTVTPNEPGAGNVCGLGILMPFAGVLLMTLGRRRPR